jgi:beta-lactamase regulating signal transducer with metallopeptidase domain/DNA-binding beta-propeller fold protein YncE
MLLGWLVGVTAFLGLLITKLIFIRTLIQSGQTPADRLISILDQARTQVNYQGSCKMVLTDALPSPAVCGLFRPVILIPTGLEGIPDQDLKLAMMHELVHIKRGDLWVNALQSLLTMIHFYNPAVWIANVMIRQLCEEAVDETVVSLEGDIKPYSHALINISELVSQKASFGLHLVGVMESKNAVFRRIKHMWTHPIPQRIRIGVFGFITIITLGAILLPMVHGAQTPPITAKDPNDYHLLVLDDCSEETDGDRLYMLNRNGDIEAVVTGFNGGSFAASHRMAVDEQRKTLWIAERQLWHLDLKNGKVLQKLPHIKARAVAIDPVTGNAWVLTSGDIGTGHIDVVSPSGHVIATHNIPGGDIAYSHHDKKFWVVGKHVYKIDTQGTVTSKIMDPIPWTALSVSIDQNNGNAWIVIGYHFQVHGSQPQLWLVDQDGKTIKANINIDDVFPYCVTVDSKQNNVWVGCLGAILRFDTKGEKLQSSRGATGSSIAFVPTKNMVFSADDHVWVNRWADDGRVAGIPIHEEILSPSRKKWIATIPFPNAKLRSSSELETMVSTIENEPRNLVPKSSSHMRKLGMALLLYANDNNDDFPDTLKQIQSNRIDVKWITDNVTYLGKGQKINYAPDTILAYDKTLLKEKDYTTVLLISSEIKVIAKQNLASQGIDVK